MAAAFLDRLAAGTSSNTLAAEVRALDGELRREPHVSRRIADFLLGDEALTLPFRGLLRYLGWTAMARFLRPVVSAFDRWRADEPWLRRYCPTSGSLPAMAQLVGVAPRAYASAFVRLLRYSLAVPANRLPVLRNRLAAALERDHRGRTPPAHRPLRVVWRLPQDIRRGRRRDTVAIRLVFTQSRPRRSRSWTEKAGGVLYEFEPARRPESMHASTIDIQPGFGARQ